MSVIGEFTASIIYTNQVSQLLEISEASSLFHLLPRQKWNQRLNTSCINPIFFLPVATMDYNEGGPLLC